MDKGEIERALDFFYRLENKMPGVDESRNVKSVSCVMQNLLLYYVIKQVENSVGNLPPRYSEEAQEALRGLLLEWQSKINTAELIRGDEDSAREAFEWLNSYLVRFTACEEEKMLIKIAVEAIEEYLHLHVAEFLREVYPEWNLPHDVFEGFLEESL